MLPVVLGAGALLWAAVVALMAVGFGYAALSRFLAPAAAVLCVLAGIAVGRAVTAPHRAVSRLAVAPRLRRAGHRLHAARVGGSARARLEDRRTAGDGRLQPRESARRDARADRGRARRRALGRGGHGRDRPDTRLDRIRDALLTAGR
ncbi:MAG: hypothetical protein GEU83_00775 [Pseudonocardiaceae bacterium]|nr:hypothetical protein [Pseudonocardiaceae bacterium]